MPKCECLKNIIFEQSATTFRIGTGSKTIESNLILNKYKINIKL